MDISEKREQIAGCIVNLKKGLKKMRRQDIDAAISILLLYDEDLKRFKKLPPQPIKKLSQEKIEYVGDHSVTYTERSIDASEAINAVVINEDGKSTAYPLDIDIETTIAKIDKGQLKPMAKVIIDPWMKEHYANEVSFMSIYATVVTGHIKVKEEEIITIGCDVYIPGGEKKVYKVTKMNSKNVWVDRGFFKSFFPIPIHVIIPLLKTKVNYFKVHS